MDNRDEREAKEEDDRLFERALSDVEPLKSKTINQKQRKPAAFFEEKRLKTLPKTGNVEPKTTIKEDLKPLSLAQFPSGRAPGIDRATSQKFVKGKIGIQGRLDLHGMTQLGARAALEDFIMNAYNEQKRALLVITGKGRHSGSNKVGQSYTATGVLRQRVPVWLSEEPFSSWVLAFTPAQPVHGGAGAIYVLLRRKAGK